MSERKRQIALYPIRATNIEVLGNRVTETSPAWTGLDWSRSRLERPDKLKLSWWHPEEPRLPDLECIYSVYPRPARGKLWRNRLVKDAWFVEDGAHWLLAVEYCRPPRIATK
jgi:hypothetical protein